MNKETAFEILRSIVAVFIALILGFVIILFISDEPIDTIYSFIFGPLQSFRHIGNVIEMAIPLIFAGLAASVVFQANLFNLGAEGIFYFSGVMAAIVGVFFTLPKGIHPFVAILIAGVVGGLINFVPGYLKAKWNASELVTSLMFNNILFGIGLYIVNYFLRDPFALATVSYKFKPTAKLSVLIPGTRIHSGIILVIFAVIFTYYFLYKTKWGYALRMTGLNRNFADYSGIDSFKVIIYSHVIAGVLAGIGGGTEILGMYNRFQWQSLPGYGFDGTLVAMLARNNPIGVVGAALFLAYIRTGADMMARMTDVPSEMVAIIQAIIILLISAERFLKPLKQKMILKEAKKYV
ncbi:ABC transporter permease [Sporanaerobacter acetigenes]|uniref:Simple sugar transport system permease protein n=1 Tax=Sporanaerobacter acetigenes DSM 13106 TaxID=1123281 RepID=A0A1M5VCH9_9FIRM|nr:ABC transporter permease [Sporanaerobacter acetigenes]SHH72891.1 simple sugar transport system permease protein [Sporanaerobacter acetigenes DSM 13106]